MPLPKPTPELRKKFLKGECDPIGETMAKAAPGKDRPVFSIGAGASTLVDGKPAKNPVFRGASLWHRTRRGSWLVAAEGLDAVGGYGARVWYQRRILMLPILLICSCVISALWFVDD